MTVIDHPVAVARPLARWGDVCRKASSSTPRPDAAMGLPPVCVLTKHPTARPRSR